MALKLISLLLLLLAITHSQVLTTVPAPVAAILSTPPQPTPPNASQLTKVDSSASSAQSIAAKYGGNQFKLIPLSVAFADPFFVLCNNYMLKGVYGNFINQASPPVYEVSVYTFASFKEYKILYISGGVQVMMCIIMINTQTQAIQLLSFVPIPVPAPLPIPHCATYLSPLQCGQCAPGYHLENNMCFANIPGCITYFQINCIECDVNYFLNNTVEIINCVLIV